MPEHVLHRTGHPNLAGTVLVTGKRRGPVVPWVQAGDPHPLVCSSTGRCRCLRDAL